MSQPEGAEHVLAAIVEWSDDAIITEDLSGVVTSWNAAAQRTFGYHASEIVGQSIRRLLPEERAGELDQILERIRRGEGVVAQETVRLTKDGRRFDVLLTVSPIKNHHGEVTGGMVIAHDVSVRRRSEAALRASEARWRAVFESAVDGIVVIDVEGRVEMINPAAERLFGYQSDDVIGRNVSMLMPSPYSSAHDGYLRNYLQTGEARIIGIGREVIGLRRDGTEFPLHLSVGEIRIGGRRGFTGILHDLSRRVRSERHLREQEALAKIGEMAAVLAHEVKNPLTAVSGAIQIIGDSLPPESPEVPIITEILARLDTLNELTNDLLLFARPPRPSLGQIDIVFLLRMTIELLAADPSHARLDIQVSGWAPSVLGDAELLKIVFQNLLLNAAYAMKEEGTIHIGVDERDDMVRVTIADEGPGIPAEVRPNLFRPFFTTKARGTGLGLSTAKRLVEAQQGTIELLWPGERGTTVVIQLPAAGG